MTDYEAAKEKYAALGVDTDLAIETLKKVPVSLHCWQLDDVIGFDNDGGLTGGIQTTGNYMGRAKTPEQLMVDMEEAMKLMPGTAKLNIHASYAIFGSGEFADRDALEPGRGDEKVLDQPRKSMYPYFGIFCERDRNAVCDEHLDR